MKKLFLLLSLSASSMLMAQSNLLNNGGMDNGECCDYVNAAHWTPTTITYRWTEGTSYPGSNGYAYGKITPAVGGTLRNYIDGADDAKIYNGVKVDANQAYTVSFWAKSEQANQVKVNIDWHTSQEAEKTSTASQVVEISGDWKQYSVTVTSAADATRAAFTLEFASANGEILLDEVVMEKAQNTTTTTQENSTNIIKFGSFEEQDPTYGRMLGWYTNSADKEQHSDVPTGTNSKKSFRLWTGSGVYLTSFYQGESNILEVEAGKTYTLSFWTKGTATDKFSVAFRWYTGTQSTEQQVVAEPTNLPTEWTKQTIQVTVPQDINKAELRISFTGGAGYAYIDEVVMEKAQNTTTTTQEGPANIVKYGSFEVQDPTYGRMVGWYTNSADKEQHSDVPAGTNSQKSFRLWTGSGVYLTSMYQGDNNILEVEAEKTYTLTFWTKGATTDKFSVAFRWYTETRFVEQKVVAKPASLPSEWTKQTIQVTVPQDINKAELRISFTGGAGYAYIDEVEMKLAEQNTTTTETPLRMGVIKQDGVYYQLIDTADGFVATVTTELENEPYYTEANRPKGNITIASNVEIMGHALRVTEIGEKAFANCPEVTSVTLPNSIREIGTSAFQNSGLTSITLPEGIAHVPVSAFANCSSLSAVTLPATTRYIFTGAFEGCTALSGITLPAALEQISGNAFKNCTALDSIRLDIANPASLRVNASAFDGVTTANVRLILPQGSEELYREHNVWRNFIVPAGIRIQGEQAEIVYGIDKAITLVLPTTRLVNICSLNGVSVYSKTMSAGTHTLALPTGFYLVKIGERTVKVLVK